MARASARTAHPAERLTALLCYALLFVAPFTLNTLGLAAILTAYARRGFADPLTRSHYDFQIRRYWTDLVLVVLGFACAAGAVAAGFGAGLEELLAAIGVRAPFHFHPAPIGLGAIALLIAWLALWAWGLLGLLLGSLWGAGRLASGLPMGKRRLS